MLLFRRRARAAGGLLFQGLEFQVLLVHLRPNQTTKVDFVFVVNVRIDFIVVNVRERIDDFVILLGDETVAFNDRKRGLR